MNVNESQIQMGVTKYLDNEVVKAIDNKATMIIAASLTNMIKLDGTIIHNVLSNPVVSMFIRPNSEGKYDLDFALQSIIEAVNTYGNFELRLPYIKQTFTFSADDFRKLKSYIEEGSANG